MYISKKNFKRELEEYVAFIEEQIDKNNDTTAHLLSVQMTGLICYGNKIKILNTRETMKWIDIALSYFTATME